MGVETLRFKNLSSHVLVINNKQINQWRLQTGRLGGK